MTEIILPYGKGQIGCDVSSKYNLTILTPPISHPARNAEDLIYESLENPIGDFQWEKIDPMGTVAIAINDKTRPVPNSLMIPPLLSRLEQLGVRKDYIEFFIATGTHTPMRNEEFGLLLPEEIIREYKIVSHDCDDSKNLKYLVKHQGEPRYT
jgi:nickel-dependent lactate racemase